MARHITMAGSGKRQGTYPPRQRPQGYPPQAASSLKTAAVIDREDRDHGRGSSCRKGEMKKSYITLTGQKMKGFRDGQ